MVPDVHDLLSWYHNRAHTFDRARERPRFNVNIVVTCLFLVRRIGQRRGEMNSSAIEHMDVRASSAFLSSAEHIRQLEGESPSDNLVDVES
jgi:hypothetical protein